MEFSVQQNIALKPYNTFGIDVTAKYFTSLHHIEQLQHLPALIQQYPKFMFLGGGSNVLFLNDFEGLIILNQIKGIHIIDNNNQFVDVEIFAGNNWHKTVQYCVHRNWHGLENLALIPGTVGAAPIQNIGAYGVELKDILVSVQAIDIKNGAKHTFSNAACEFGYRESIFKNKQKNKYFIYSIIIRLQHQANLNTNYGAINAVLEQQNITQATIKDVFEAVIAIRESKLPNPKVLGNSGSFFKNPIINKTAFENLQQNYPNLPHYIVDNDKVKIPAAWLIEQCGFKGKRNGNTGNHTQQALVLVNYGHATGQEIWQHAQLVIQTVKEKFNISLEPEVNIIE